MLSTVEKVLFLKSIDLFSQIPGDSLAQIALIANEERREVGEQICGDGECGDALYLVVEGKIRVHHRDRQATELDERGCFGETAILESVPGPASVTAVSATRLLKISREDFQEIMLEKPEIALGVIKVLSRRLRDLAR
jgi:CRP/FNR family transcriptional regulator, cyclic AMP receptor protein